MYGIWKINSNPGGCRMRLQTKRWCLEGMDTEPQSRRYPQRRYRKWPSDRISSEYSQWIWCNDSDATL